MSKKSFFLLVSLITLLKIVITAILPLGNDEVYYLLYGKYPDLHYYDHPLFVGWFLKFFSLDFFIYDKIFYRIFALVLSTATLFVVYRTTLFLSDKASARIATVLCISAIYLSVIAGVFVMPDAPFAFFYTCTLYFAVKTFFDKTKVYQINDKYFILCVISLGCTVLSKFHGVFLVLGLFLFILFYRRQMFRHLVFYEGALILMLFTIPILYWNYQHDWVQFSFYKNRVVSNSTLNINYNGILKEFIGQFAYLNPIVFVFVVYVLSFKYNMVGKIYKKIFLLFSSLPMLLFIYVLSLFKETLPHWSGVAYIPLIILSSIIAKETMIHFHTNYWQYFSVAFLLFISISGIYFIYNYPGTIGNQKDKLKYGSGDFTLDMYGWEKSGMEIIQILKEKNLNQYPIISDNWFPAGHIDEYIARPSGTPFFCVGEIEQIHQYQWINVKRGDWRIYDTVITIVPSNYYRDPTTYLSKYYKGCQKVTEVVQYRNGGIARFFQIYILSK